MWSMCDMEMGVWYDKAISGCPQLRRIFVRRECGTMRGREMREKGKLLK